MSPDTVRVYVVVDWRRQRVNGVTCDVNQSQAWVRELIDKYGDPRGERVASQTVALVDPAGQDIPMEGKPVDPDGKRWPTGHPGWLSRDQDWPCGRCRQETADEPHDCPERQP